MREKLYNTMHPGQTKTLRDIKSERIKLEGELKEADMALWELVKTSGKLKEAKKFMALSMCKKRRASFLSGEYPDWIQYRSTDQLLNWYAENIAPLGHKYQEGIDKSRRVRNGLVSTLYPYVMKLIGKHCNTISSYKAGKVTFDDLIQEGYIATLKAIGAWTFDNALTTVIGLYIPFEMKRFNKAFGSIVRPPFNRKDSQNIQIISLDCLVSTNADSNSFLDSLLFSNDAEINYENNVIKTLDYASLKDSIKKLNMTKTEKQIVSLWLKGTDISKIAKSMCLSRQYIDIKIKEIKNGAVEKRDRKPFSLRGTIKTKAKDKNNSSSKDNDKSLITHVIDTSGATHTDIGTCKNKVKKTQKILYKQHIISKTGLSYTTLVDILNKFGIHRGRKYFTRKEYNSILRYAKQLSCDLKSPRSLDITADTRTWAKSLRVNVTLLRTVAYSLDIKGIKTRTLKEHDMISNKAIAFSNKIRAKK